MNWNNIITNQRYNEKYKVAKIIDPIYKNLSTEKLLLERCNSGSFMQNMNI